MGAVTGLALSVAGETVFLEEETLIDELADGLAAFADAVLGDWQGEVAGETVRGKEAGTGEGRRGGRVRRLLGRGPRSNRARAGAAWQVLSRRKVPLGQEEQFKGELWQDLQVGEQVSQR